MKKYSLVSVVLIFVFSLSTVLFAQGGDIQITCEPELRIYLDGKFVGKSNSNEDGKYLSNISSGRHTIRVEKTGFTPKEFIRDIRAGEVIEIKVGKLEPPRMTVTQRGESLVGDLHLNVGNLKVFSAPMRCEIEFRGHTFKKEKPEIEFGKVPTGTHYINFKRKGKSLSYRVEIKKGKTIEIKVDFLKGKVFDITKKKKPLITVDRTENQKDRVSVTFKTSGPDNVLKTGISAGGGGYGPGSGIGGFPYAYYVEALRSKISSSWYSALVSPGLRGRFLAVVYFKISRNGRIQNLKLEEKSGINALDLSALRAVENAAPFPPLPNDYRNPYLEVYFGFLWEKK